MPTDAARHAYLVMLLKTFTNPEYPNQDHALELPMAHEVSNLDEGHPNYDIIMDLFNNKVGFDSIPNPIYLKAQIQMR